MLIPFFMMMFFGFVSSSMPIMPIGSYETSVCDCPLGTLVLMPIMPIGLSERDYCLCDSNENKAGRGSGLKRRPKGKNIVKSEDIKLSPINPAMNETRGVDKLTVPNQSVNKSMNQGYTRSEYKNSTTTIRTNTTRTNGSLKKNNTEEKPKNTTIVEKSGVIEMNKTKNIKSSELNMCSALGLTYLKLFSDDSCKQLKSEFDITNVIVFTMYTSDSPEKDSDKSSTLTPEQRFTDGKVIISKFPRDVEVRDILDGVDVLRAGYGGKCSFGIKVKVCYSVPTKPDPVKRERGNGCRIVENGVETFKEVNYESYGSFLVESKKNFTSLGDPIEQVLSPYGQMGNCFDSFEKNNR